MNEMAKAFLEGPKPGINYGAMSGRAPELTAQIEQIDKSMFTLAQALFLGLVDEARVENDGNLHHLLLTQEQRVAMVRLINNIFGDKLGEKDATDIVSAAWVIKYGLTRSIYTSADEAYGAGPSFGKNDFLWNGVLQPGERAITLGKGETLGATLRDLGATPEEIKAILATLGTRANYLKEGQKLRVLLSPVPSSRRLQPVHVMLINENQIEAATALSELGRYVAVDVSNYSHFARSPRTEGSPLRN
jgi:hypothetical protein